MRSKATAAAALLLAACGSQSGGANQQAGTGSGGAPTGGGGAVTLQPGEWEVTVAMGLPDMPNLPAGTPRPNIPPTTARSCLTPEQVSRANASFLGGGNQHGVDCDYSGVTIANGRIQGVSTCRRNDMEVSMTMDGNFTPTAYDVNQQIRTTMRGRTSESSGRLTGRRIGDCPAGGAGK
jgi:hypothetical protein